MASQSSYFYAREPVAISKPQRSQWSMRDPFGFRPISVACPTTGFDHWGKIFQGITCFLLDGDITLFDTGAAVDVSYFRNEDVVDCVENRAMDSQKCLDWKTTLKVRF